MRDFADAEQTGMKWYVVKVQSNREKSIRDLLIRRYKREGLDELFGQVFVPVERQVDNKSGKSRVIEQKLYPGYLLVEMILNEETWFLVRNTNGVGDFTGTAGNPTPLPDSEVQRILSRQITAAPVISPRQLNYRVGDTVTIKEGAFAGFKGLVDLIDDSSSKVTVLIDIFGRPTPVDLESWQATKD